MEPRVLQALGQSPQALLHRRQEAAAAIRDLRQYLASLGHGELGRGLGRGRAHVGDEVSDGEIGLVSHAGDDGNL
jgi:hypothetical protein